jgi:hypothetical protein
VLLLLPSSHPAAADLHGRNDAGCAQAQELPSPITTGDKLRASDHRLYLWQDGQGGAGFIKVGTKHLFYMVSHARALLLTPGLAEILLLALLGLLGFLGLLRTLAPIHLPHASALLQSNTGVYSEMDPLCVLDFYVQESCQRGGVGIGLFHAMQQVRSANSLPPFSAKLYALATHHFACVLDF